MPSRQFFVPLSLAAAMLLSIAAPSWAAPKEKDAKPAVLKIGKEDSVATAGIKLKVFKDAVQRPLPAITEHTLVNQATGAKIEAYDFIELWFHEQCVGHWATEGGSIYVGQVTLPVPKGLPALLDNFGKKESYDKWREAASPGVEPAELQRWLTAFARANLDGEPSEVKGSPGVTLKRCRFKGSDSSDKALYLASNPKSPEQTFAVLYEMGNVADRDKCEKAIELSAESISFFQPKKAVEQKQMTTSKTKRKKEWSDKYLASREQVIGNIRNLKDWWFLETENYIICSNLKRKNAINEVQVEVENGRLAYSKIFPIIEPVDAVSVVRVFETREGYTSYLGKEYEWTGGLWMPAKKELVISPSEGAQGQKRVERLVRVLYHEAFHQYLHFATGQTSNADWFNEGVAQVFEDLDFKPGGKFTVEPEELRQLAAQKAMLSPYGTASKLISTSHDEFIAKKNVEDAYPCAWALLYFLLKGAPVMKGKEAYAEIPARYYKTVIETKDVEKATKAAWDGVDMSQFDKDWHEFWESKSLFHKSKNFDLKPVVAPVGDASGKPASGSLK